MSDTASLPPAYQQATTTPFRDPLRAYQSLPHEPPSIPRSSTFIKESKQGAVSLKLTGQRPSSTPVYGHGALIDGSVEVAKLDDIQSVELKVCSIVCLVYFLAHLNSDKRLTRHS
jgi:hypothetical protein